MLNEWKEYNSYLSDNLQDVPIHNDALDGRKGFRRILQILAKGFLEKWEVWEKESGTIVPFEQKVSATKWFLRSWSEGLPPSEIPVYGDLPPILQEDMRRSGRNGLMALANKVLGSRKNLDALIKGVSLFNDAPYLPQLNLAWNDVNRIYYDQIISDAINRVPLRRQCLVLEGPSALDGIRCAENLREVALGCAVLFLQGKDEYPSIVDREYLSMVYAEVGNWLNVYFTNKGANRRSVPLAVKQAKTPEGELLFEQQHLPSGNKFRLNPKWLAQYKVRLVDETSLKDLAHAGCWIVRDRQPNDTSLLHIEKADTMSVTM